MPRRRRRRISTYRKKIKCKRKKIIGRS